MAINNNTVIQFQLLLLQVLTDDNAVNGRDIVNSKRLQASWPDQPVEHHERPCEAGMHWNWIDRAQTKGICTRHYEENCVEYDTSVGKCNVCRKNCKQVKWNLTHACSLYGLNQFDREWLAFAGLFILSMSCSVIYGIVYTIVKYKQDKIDAQLEAENRQGQVSKRDSKSMTGGTENSTERRIIGVPSKADIHNYLRKAFDIYDSEKLGYVLKDDLAKQTYHSCVNLKLETITDSQLDRIVDIVNDNNDGKFTFRQLVKVVGPILEQQFKRAYIMNLEKMKKDLNNKTTNESTDADIKMKSEERRPIEKEQKAPHSGKPKSANN